jgi:catechol 2,3-dioxygenase-like lactoylglutathione lyase family enzyme
MKVIEIAFVAYPVKDLKRAEHFYAGTLGLKESRRWGDENKAWIEYDIGSGTLAICNLMDEWKPSPNGGGAGLEVEDFNAAIADLKTAGVKFIWEAQDTPVCHMALVADPDGNSICIHKRKS